MIAKMLERVKLVSGDTKHFWSQLPNHRSNQIRPKSSMCMFNRCLWNSNDDFYKKDFAISTPKRIQISND